MKIMDCPLGKDPSNRKGSMLPYQHKAASSQESQEANYSTYSYLGKMCGETTVQMEVQKGTMQSFTAC
jgi:hypothetical protein